MKRNGLGYEQLNADEKIAYEILVEALLHHQKSCDVSKVKRNVNIMHVLTTALGDNPEIIFFNKTMIRTMGSLFGKQLSFVGCMERRQAELAENKLKEAMEDAVWEIDKAAKNDKDILRGISEFLQRTAIYDRDELNSAMRGRSINPMAHNAYGPLVDHKGVCDGFSSAYSLIAQYFGFRCMIVEGKSSYQRNEKIDHAWNIIEYNKNYFHIDSTWDTNTYEVINEYSYDYFGLEDDEIAIDHDWNYQKTPKCSSSELSYFVSNGFFAQSESQIEDILFKCMRRDERVIRVKISPSISLGKSEEYLREVMMKAASRAHIYKPYNYVWQECTRCLIIKMN